MAKYGSKSIKGISGEYLSPNEVLFIDKYMASGMQNAWQCYMEVFTEAEEKGAKRSAYKLLKRKSIVEEIEARFAASKVTVAWILQKGISYVESGETDKFRSSAGQKALEMMAKYKHMLDAEMKLNFGDKQPIFLSPYSKEEYESMQEKRLKGGRIQE